MLPEIALLTVTALAVWVLGSVVLRWGGAFIVLASLATTSGDARSTVLGVALGALAWLAGHWLFAVRHHVYRSPVARRIFLQLLPSWLDPTRRWGIRTID